MILKIVDRGNTQGGNKLEKVIDNVSEIYKKQPTEKEAWEWHDKASYTIPSSFYGDDNDRHSDTRICTFLTVTRHNPISNDGYMEHHILYHSRGDVCDVTVFYMNDKGVTIDRLDV